MMKELKDALEGGKTVTDIKDKVADTFEEEVQTEEVVETDFSEAS
jgi:hypothetical protein